jgi:hypothetical protein
MLRDQLISNKYETNSKHIQNFIRKSDMYKPITKHRRRWVYMIKIGLWEVGCDDGDWVCLLESTVAYKPIARKRPPNT